MLEILAIAPEDGWAFVEAEGRVRLIRPPYTKAATMDVTHESAENAVSRFGFIRPPEDGRSYFDWSKLIEFLNAEVVRSRKNAGAAVLEDDVAGRLLALAPLTTLKQFLTRIQDELIPNQAWEHAERLLLGMLSLPAFREHGDQVQRAIELLRRVTEARKLSRTGSVQHIPFDAAFPSVGRVIGQDQIEAFSAEILSRSTVLNFSE